MESTPPLTQDDTQDFHLFALLPTELRQKIYASILEVHNPGKILKISYSPISDRYISNTPPPVTLFLNAESRHFTQTHLGVTYLHLGKPPNNLMCTYNRSVATTKTLYQPGGDVKAGCWSPIPWCRGGIVYLGMESVILELNINEILYAISTSPSRHIIRKMAVNLRVWSMLCENGLVAVLARMWGLRTLYLVVEFGRSFKGELAFIEAPEWRGDLRYLAEQAGRRLRDERRRFSGFALYRGLEKQGDVDVRCVILTRGGEQA